MPAPRRRGVQERVDYVFVERDGLQVAGEEAVDEPEPLTKTVNRAIRRSYTRRGMATPTGTDYDSDDDDDDEKPTTAKRPIVLSTATPSGPPSVRMTPCLGSIMGLTTKVSDHHDHTSAYQWCFGR
jgi:hypothetical protein